MIAAAKPKTAPALWRAMLAAFWSGASTPSRTGLAALLAAFTATLAFSVWFFSPTAMAGRMGDYLPRSPLDAEAFATVQAVRLGTHWIELPTIIALGSSTIAQSLGDGSATLEELHAATGQNWSFISLTTPQQSPLDQIALLQTALAGHQPDGPPLVILLSTSGQRLTWTPQRILDGTFQNRLGLQSSWATEEIAQLNGTPPRQTGMYVIDNFGFVCLNGTEALLRMALGRPAEQRIAAYATGPERLGPDRAIASLRGRYILGQDNVDAYLALQNRLLERLSAFANVHVVLMDEPFAPDALQDLGLTALHSASEDIIAKFASDNGLEYLTPIAQSGLEPQDFHDTFHIKLGEPQDRVQRQLGQQLADLITRRGL